MLTKVLDRLLLLAVLYFLYMLIFHLPPRWTTPQAQPKSDALPNSEPREHLICSNNENANLVMNHFLHIQNQNLDTIKQGGKFVVYSATDLAGLGNRIPPLVASFMLALVTDRGFLVHWPEVSETKNREYEEIAMPVFGDLFVPPVPIDIMTIPNFHSFINNDTTTILRLDESADLLLCGDFDDVFSNSQFVVVKGWRPFFDLLFHNKHVSAKLYSLGLINLVHELATCLLRPVPKVGAVIREFKTTNRISSKQKIVGVHIRKYSQHGLSKTEQEGLWGCVRKKYPPPSIPLVWEDLDMASDGSALPDPSRFGNASFLYFLASDSEDTISVVPPDFLPYVVKIVGDNSRNTENGIIRALADIWVLGNSVEVFGAQGTTFLAAVRTIFPTKTSLAVLGGNKVDKYCRSVGELPCYKWWDIFKSQDSANYSLSCFVGSARSKDVVVC